MKIFVSIFLVLALVACGGEKDTTPKDFDAYLEMLMAEPYDPENGSIY